MSAQQRTVTTPRQTDDDTSKAPWRVILYNDDYHTFDEVIDQLCLATGCNRSKAARIAWQAHRNGRADAFVGPKVRCQEVCAVLRLIRLQSEIDEAI